MHVFAIYVRKRKSLHIPIDHIIISCFVDFSKAFDSIPRETLFNKLVNIGINGKFFNNLKTLYENDICRVKLENGITNTFIANQGVKVVGV